jgi:hypothetical protein
LFVLFVGVRLEWKWQNLRAINGQIRCRSRQAASIQGSVLPSKRHLGRIKNKKYKQNKSGIKWEQNGNSCYYVRTNNTEQRKSKKIYIQK